MSTIFQTFKEIGYLTVPNFIDKGQVNSLRDIGESLLGKQNDFTLKPTSFLKDPILSSIIFNQNFIRVLDDLSQEYRFFLPNFTVRKSLYIGWHTDDEFVEVDKDELPGVLQCNIYLQDNTGKNGGGIDIFPGSHRLEKIKKKALIEENKINCETVKTQAGDLLIFDYRVIHRSSIADTKNNLKSRLALQWTVCKSEKRASTFMQYLARRQQERLHL